MDENLSSSGIPFALIAHRDGQFVGTVSVIPNDLDEQPDLSPWVAAVWVEPLHRHTGVGTKLVETALKRAFAVTKGAVYLCAERRLAPFYQSMGWEMIEKNVGGLDVYREDRGG